ncbi:DUF7344 domain-containing protein [Haloprofundus halobius]|uniref:DUF7344 domain-containing protein n=1 Tax=Haloprofundus halobius TaxID=2876194 RepID=UPI001CC9CE8B|nr:hypothetical protein [Haloprofundus halobius]
MTDDELPDDWAAPPTADEGTRRRLDALLSLLADRRRRDLLYHLETVELTDVGTLAPKVASVSEGASIDDISPDVLQQVQIDLVHVQLPKLADIGAIEYDRRSEMIRCRTLPPMLGQLVDCCRDIEAAET